MQVVQNEIRVSVCKCLGTTTLKDITNVCLEPLGIERYK